MQVYVNRSKVRFPRALLSPIKREYIIIDGYASVRHNIMNSACRRKGGSCFEEMDLIFPAGNVALHESNA